jgi:hypothetical protein
MPSARLSTPTPNSWFYDAKDRYGFEHICHHHPNSLLIHWLLTAFALTIEHLYRLRYLHGGAHRIRTAINLLRSLPLGLSLPAVANTS